MISYLLSLPSRWKFYKKSKAARLINNKLSSSVYIKHPSQSTFGGKKVLNFGCGGAVFKASNVVNVDCTPGPYITVVPEDQVKLPFADETFDYIIANHVMEHIPQWFETFKEFSRVLKTGGTIEIWIPPISSDSAFAYRDHINRIGWESFYGIGDLRRPGDNALAAVELKDLTQVEKLHVIGRSKRAIAVWWTTFAPDFVLEWMSEHLRNIISEEGYFFIKGE